MFISCKHIGGSRNPACSCYDRWDTAVSDASEWAWEQIDDPEVVQQLLDYGVPKATEPKDEALGHAWVDFCHGDTGQAVEVVHGLQGLRYPGVVVLPGHAAQLIARGLVLLASAADLQGLRPILDGELAIAQADMYRATEAVAP